MVSRRGLILLRDGSLNEQRLALARAGPTFLAPPRKVAKEGGSGRGFGASPLPKNPPPIPLAASALSLNQVVYQATDDVT